MDSLDQLIPLLERCTVRLSTPSPSGTGFFVAHGLILTCAHVVKDSQNNPTTVEVKWGDKTYQAKILHLLPSYDLALLKLEKSPATHPCVFLHEAVQVRDELYSYGYTRDYPHGEPATFDSEGTTGNPVRLLTFKLGQAKEGFSGAPIFNFQTGCVCGVMSITKGQNTLLGGRGIPTSVVLEQFEELVTLQKEFHDRDRHWYDLLPESEVKQFSWPELRAICSKITEIRMLSTVQNKYNEELYLQRDHAHQAFMRFLEDPTKRGFVLVGGSGVGKSNFLLSVREELQTREDVCVLMYDAGSPMEHPLMETINEDFYEQVGWTIQRVWEKIKNIDGIDQRLVLFCVDALNEHEQPRPLLKQLNELIQRPWPWLKVVIVSRPEAWQSIKRRVKLAETLYYRGEDETPGAILESFNFSEHLEPFSRQELPLVYAKYWQVNQVQTPYEKLSSWLRDIISDPFNLWLVTSTYRTKAIPKHLKTATLIEEYLNALIKQGERLQVGDPDWLENQLVPLMVSEGHYERFITTEELDAADHALYRALLDRTDSNGLPLLPPFTNLVDADILTREPRGISFTIAFEDERFYDFFVGRRLFDMSEAQADQYAYFLDMIGRTTERPYLWGAVRNALVQEATEKPDVEIVLKLCRIPDQRVREMMVSVLTTLGQDDEQWQKVNVLLDKLVPVNQPPSEWHKIQQFLGKGTVVLNIALGNASSIAIEVAGNLGLPPILQRAALQADPTLQTKAVRYSYYLWQHDFSKGYGILEQLALYASSGFLPDVNALRSVFGFSLVILFKHYQDPAISARLQSIWQKIIVRILRIRGEDTHGREAVARTFIRELFISSARTVIFSILDSLPGYTITSYDKLKQFFQLTPDKKELYRRIVGYIDIDATFSTEQMEHDYLEMIKINDLLFVYVFDLSIVPRACHDPVAVLPLLRKLYSVAQSDVTAYPYLSDIANALENILNSGPFREDIFEFFVSVVETSQEIYTDHPHCIRNRHTIAPKATFLGAYILHQYRRSGTVREDGWLEKRISEALSHKNMSFFDLLLTVELPFVALEWQKPVAALEVLEMFLQGSWMNPLEEDDKNISQFIIAFLARLRINYPDEVDDFLEQQVDDFLKQPKVTLEQQQAAKVFPLQVRTSEAAETIGELVGQKVLYFVRDEVILHSPDLRSQLMQIFAKAADCKDSKTWLDYAIRQVVNAIYGGEALRQAK